MTPDIVGQAAALRAAAAFIGVPRAAGGPAARTGLAAAAGAPGLRHQPGPWQETITAAGEISGHRAVITAVICEEEGETA